MEPVIKNINIHGNTFKDNSLLSPPKAGLLQKIITAYQFGANFSGSPQVAPAIIYGGIGELLSNAGALADFDTYLVGDAAKEAGIDHDAYSAADAICVHDNIKNTGNFNHDLNVAMVYGTDPTDSSNFKSGIPEPTLRIDLMANNTLLDCTPERLEPAVVTIKGTVYGCTGDDAALAACSL